MGPCPPISQWMLVFYKVARCLRWFSACILIASRCLSPRQSTRGQIPIGMMFGLLGFWFLFCCLLMTLFSLHSLPGLRIVCLLSCLPGATIWVSRSHCPRPNGWWVAFILLSTLTLPIQVLVSHCVTGSLFFSVFPTSSIMA